jgi:hypothetical protein
MDYINNTLKKKWYCFKEASVGEIKRAYRELSKKHHPDRGGDPEKFVNRENFQIKYNIHWFIERNC